MTPPRDAKGSLLLCLLALLLAVTRPALADSAASARYHDEEARRHFAANQYDQALRRFFVVQRIAPTTTTLYNIALCFRRLSRIEDEFNYLQEYLAGTDTNPERRRIVGQRIEELAQQVARLRVRSDPPGASVYLDRKELGTFGVTPLVVAAPRGTHRVIVEALGHAPFETEVELVTGKLTLIEPQLKRIVGRTTFMVPDGSQIVIQDPAGQMVAKGQAPQAFELPPGSYSARIDAHGFRTHHGWLEVRPRELTAYRPHLDPLPAPTGELTFTSNLPGALIELDGKLVGFAPLVLPDVPTGIHRFKVSRPGTLPHEGELRVVAGQLAWLTTTLERRREPPVPPAVLWATAGLGVASFVGASVFGIMTAATHSKWEDEPGDQGLTNRGKRRAAWTDGLLVTGAVLSVTSVVLWALNGGPKRQPKSITTIARTAP